MKTKDYLILKEIEFYLENRKDELIRENNGYTNNHIEEVKKLLEGLRKVLDKLENEE